MDEITCKFQREVYLFRHVVSTFGGKLGTYIELNEQCHGFLFQTPKQQLSVEERCRKMPERQYPILIVGSKQMVCDLSIFSRQYFV